MAFPSGQQLAHHIQATIPSAHQNEAVWVLYRFISAAIANRQIDQLIIADNNALVWMGSGQRITHLPPDRWHLQQIAYADALATILSYDTLVARYIVQVPTASGHARYTIHHERLDPAGEAP